jgi:hypothetical protein
MTIKNTVGTLTHGAVSTAVSVARHPINTAAMAAGLVKGTAEAGIDLVRGVVRGPVAHRAAPTEPSEKVPAQKKAAQPVREEPATTGPREPEVVPKPVLSIDELPEPIVIEADDQAGDQAGEAFHTEPKAASRDSEHGGQAGDREEAEGYVEEIPDASNEEDQVVWTSESAGPPQQ